jgi:hypothetical protein
MGCVPQDSLPMSECGETGEFARCPATAGRGGYTVLVLWFSVVLVKTNSHNGGLIVVNNR